MQNYKAVVFDMDGVIFDSEKAVIECWKVIAGKYDIVDVEAACRDCLGSNAHDAKQKFLNRYGAEFTYDEYRQEMSDLYHSKYDGGKLPVKTGVRELLRFLCEAGVKVALASSTRKEVVVQELTDAGLIEYFQVIIGGDMVERSKPFPDIYLKACEELGVLPEEAYAIEDSYNGIRSAAAGRLRPLMVPDILAPTEEMKMLSEEILDDLLEVREYLGNK